MGDARTTFCVVTTLETAPAREAGFFVAELHRRKLPLGAVIVNKALPDDLLRDGPRRRGVRLPRRCRRPGRGRGGSGRRPTERVRRVLGEVGESFANYAVVATREAEQRAELATTADVLVTVPILDEPVNDLASLVRLGQCCWR